MSQYRIVETPALANVLEYCWRIGEEEEVDIEDENIKTLFELRPIHFIYYFEFLVFETENVMAGAKPTGYRSNSLLAYKRSTSFTCHCAMTLTCILTVLAVERSGQVYGVNQAGDLSGFSKRVGRKIAPSNIFTSSSTEYVHLNNNNNYDKVEETHYRKEDHMKHVDEDSIVENRNNIDTSDIIQESIDGIGSLILPTEDSTHNIDTPADEVTTSNLGNIFPGINNEEDENDSNKESHNERSTTEKDCSGEIAEHTAGENIKDNESTTTMADKPESSLSESEDQLQGVKDGEDRMLIEVDVADHHETLLGKEEIEEIGELTEQEPIFIPDDDELVDDNLFRDIIQDGKIDPMNQNGIETLINDNGETTNSIKPNNVDNQGTTATIISPKTREYDNRPTEEEMITYSLFQLYSYILTIFLFILCFSIWIMWLRYNDVISAVHGSKGALFFETPPHVRVTENWTGLPGAHFAFIFVSGVWNYSVAYHFFLQGHIDYPLHHKQHGLYKRIRARCTAMNPCSCYRRKKSCLCAMGTDIGKDCIEKPCSWIVNEATGVEQCRGCSARDCEACTTDRDCKNAGDNNKFCIWKSKNDLDRELNLRTKISSQNAKSVCNSRCSIYNCGFCDTFEKCHKKSMCAWNGHYCNAKCSIHNCHGCDTRAACESNSHFCTWDKRSEFCAMRGVLDIKNGFGCWTINTMDNCEKVLVSGSKCKWDSDMGICNGENSDTISPYHGNVYNFNGMELVRIDRVVGNLMLESTSKANKGADGEEEEDDAGGYYKWGNLQVVYGDLYIRHNLDLEELFLNYMTYIYGNIYLEDNPKLKAIEYNKNLIIKGCVKIDGCPKVTESVIKFLQSKSLKDVNLCNSMYA
eukprot:g2950.t1